MRLFLIFLAVLGTSTYAKVVPPPAKFTAACQNVYPTAAYSQCYIDMTVAIDMSTAMGNIAHVDTLASSILQSFLPQFGFYDTYVAGLAFGGSTIGSSIYYNNYADICEYIFSAEQQASSLGLSSGNLSEVFQTYRVDLLNTGRLYQKVLVLFTAISDPVEIATAKTYSDQLKAAGVHIIVVGLAQSNSTTLGILGDNLYLSLDYNIPEIGAVTSETCSWSGISYTPPESDPTSGPTNPLSNAIGAECSKNVSNAWLDVIFVIDTSNAMARRDLLELGGEIATFMNDFTFGQTGDHTTRAAIVTYSTLAVSRYNLTDVTDSAGFQSAILNIGSYANEDDSGGNVQGALQLAHDLISAQRSKRVPAIILIAAAYDPIGFQGAGQTANIIKDDGISILTVSFAAADGVLTSELKNLSTPGYSYVSNQEGIYLSLPEALTQINCFCPASSLQFRYFNPLYMNYTSYADCLFGFDGDTLPSLATFLCAPGILAPITSQAKFDFVADYIVPHDLKSKKKFTIGAHLSATSGQWSWWGYNRTEYPMGYYPPFNNTPAAGDKYGYMFNYRGFNWQLKTEGNVPMPYLCQSRACDADYICDQTQP